MTSTPGSSVSSDPRLQPKPAHAAVMVAHAATLKALPFHDRQDFEDAARGFIDTLPDAIVTNPAGRTVWSLAPYAFLRAETAPATVNPSLWRQAQLNMHHGLFKVVDGLYQVRGLDIANMTLVEGKTGLIVIDTLTSVEGARAGLELYFKHRGNRPIVAVIYTHTHTDHWGGVRGVVAEADVKAGRVPIIAPDLFMEHAVSENVIAGNAMLRRAHYQFGPLLAKGPQGHVDCGLGKTMTAGTVSLLAPTDLIKTTGEKRVIDGIEIVFQMAPETEAPAEMHIYLPAFNALNLAENATHNFHNLLPFRGSMARDAFGWAKYINEALDLWGSEAEVLLGQHHWPIWGNARVTTHLKQQRDLYKSAHDQTVRLMNHGLTAAEIAEQIRTPASLEAAWHARGYYGHIKHNAKAIYQRYLGWYDGNPAHLDPLPPAETGTKMLEYMGGASAVLQRARADIDKGEFRFAAQVLNHVVFAEPANIEARALLADAYEQLGYLAESSTWRNAYLFGAQELRLGMPQVPTRTQISADTITALRTDQFFDYLSVRLNAGKAAGHHIVLNWRFTDTNEDFVLNLENGALTHSGGRQATDADATLTLTRATLDAVTQRTTTFGEAIAAGKIAVAGDAGKLSLLLSMLDEFVRMFEIVAPKGTLPT
jgi:alkyl sulfatase BDS1-like metallo-beta-lactamase superfamily hydrolase